MSNGPPVGRWPPVELRIRQPGDDRADVLTDVADLLEVAFELGIQNRTLAPNCACHRDRRLSIVYFRNVGDVKVAMS